MCQNEANQLEPNQIIQYQMNYCGHLSPSFLEETEENGFFCKRIEARVRFHEKPTFGQKESLGKCGNSVGL